MKVSEKTIDYTSRRRDYYNMLCFGKWTVSYASFGEVN